MFEAIHGSAPRMVEEGRVEYADPSGLIRAGAMLLNHIGFEERGRKLEMALEICDTFEKKMVVTGRPTGVKGSEFTDYLLSTLKDSRIEARWQEYQAGMGVAPLMIRHPSECLSPSASSFWFPG